MFKTTIKGILAHKVRLALTAVAIILGVSFMAGTFMLTDTIKTAFDNLFAQTAVGRDTTVRARTPYKSTGFEGANVQRANVPDSLVDTVRHIPGVKVADGVVQGVAQLVGKDGKVLATHGAPAFGANWLPDHQLSSFKVRTGQGPTNGNEIAIDARTFKDKGFRLGDRVTVLTAQAPRQFTIVGSLGFGSQDNLGGATFIIFDGPTAQQLLAKPGQWNEVEAAAVPGVSAAELTSRISQVLPNQYEAVTAASAAQETAKAIEHGIGNFTIFLLVFAGIALFVGAFIIYNTFSILITQRTRELALLRAVGASRSQVMRSVMAEAVAVGVFASVVGLGAGALIATGMKALFKAIGFGLPQTSLQILPRTIIVSLIVGTVVTFVSSVIPARRASRIAPVAAMTEATLSEQSSLRTRTISGVVVGAIGVALLASGLFGGPSNAALIVGVGAGLVFIAVAMLSPLITTPMAQVLGAPMARVGGMTGQLSRENAMRNPKRTASTAAALMVGVALVTVIATVGATLKSTVSRIIDDSVKADYIVSPSGGNFQGFSPQIAKDLAARPELAAVSGYRQGRWHSGTATKELAAVDAVAGPKVVNFSMTSGSVSSLAQGEVLVDDATAKSHHLKVGASLAMGFDATGLQHLTVGGTYAANQIIGNYVISLATYDQNYPRSLDDLVLIKDRASPAASLAAIKPVTAPYVNVTVKDQTAFKTAQKKQLNVILTLGYILLAFSILIALIGIMNTLALSVIERTRELGLLRAVGMMRRQVRRMVRGESILVCLMGAMIGVAVGIGLGLALVAAINFSGATVVTIPVSTLVVVVIMAGVSGVVAAIFPARRAARLDVLAAIATA
jgi:putative ABC transport system permease protein